MTPCLSAVFKPRAHRQEGRRECNRGANPWLAHQSLSAAAAAKAAYSAVPTDDIDGTMGQRTHPPRGESTRVSVAARTLRHGLIDDDLRGRYRATITSRAKQPASRRTPRSRAVSRHKPSNAAMNSRVPAGPETSSTVGPPVRFDGDHKTQKPAALALGVHDVRKRRNRIGNRRDPHTEPVLGELVVLGTSEQVGEESIPSSLEGTPVIARRQLDFRRSFTAQSSCATLRARAASRRAGESHRESLGPALWVCPSDPRMASHRVSNQAQPDTDRRIPS
jgi:hypothetical protein